MSTATVTAGKVVVFHYTLTGDAGQVIDSSAGREPLPYLHGAGNIVPGLERQMLGRSAGDRFEAIVPPDEGYGDHNGRPPQAVPRNAFPDDVEVQPGMQFAAQTPTGQMIPLWVVGVEEDQVLVDDNHPLAGQTLTFNVEIVQIRDATEGERQHGHPHGIDGTAHH